jgi:hypothetical protein
VFRFSLRESAALLIGISICFGSSFLPAQKLGALMYLWVIAAVVLSVTCFTVFYLLKRLAVTTGFLLALAESIGAMMQFSQSGNIFDRFGLLLIVTAIPTLFVTVPLTLLRRSDGPLDRQFK